MRNCPACDGETVEVKCKVYCPVCHRVIENCSGDDRAH